LLKELEKLEEEYPEYKNENSPSLVVGSSLKNTKFQKIEHKKAMLSLSNTYNISDVENFDKRIKKTINKEIDYVLELKLDGLSISVIYEKGKLVKGVTRGDGQIGEDVTENIMEILSIPHFLKENIDLEVRGEIVLPLSKFEELNKKRVENGEEIFANPRNAASGTIRQLNSSIVKERELDCYFYYLVDGEKYGLETHAESLEYIKSLGFKTTDIYNLCKNVVELENAINYWEKRRNELDYETDGLVIKVNKYEYHNILGNTTKSPRWAIAYKFPAKQATTKLLDITFQVGRTGTITPVAELQEVEVSGSKVKRASLHNFDEIRRKDIRIGDTVFIEKAAEIIPQVVKSIKEARTGNEKEIKEPTNCPVCGTELIQEEGLVAIKCPNADCPAKVQRKIEYFVSRDAMNIDGLGSKIIEKLIEIGKIENITDIYRLKDYKDELENLDKMGEKSVANLLLSIEESKTRAYSKTLYALGIPFVGKFLAKLLSDHSKNIDELINLDKESLLEIDGVGEKVADSVYNFFRNSENIKLIETLKKEGVNFEVEARKEVATFNEEFKGKNFLFTGKLQHFTRSEIKEKIEELGGVNVTSVSAKLDYLVVGEKAGSKLKKAQELGTVKIISEEDFVKMVEG
jgi:DNA ligase (NAD+)